MLQVSSFCELSVIHARVGLGDAVVLESFLPL